jgi:Fic family protein
MVKQVLAHIEQLKKQLSELQPLSAESQQRLDKKFRLEWNYNSNHMEGNTLTYDETTLLLMFDQTKGNHELREYEEMKGHDVALKLVYDLVEHKERTLNENFIRQLNTLLLVRPFFKEAITPDGQPTRREIKVGEYKSFPNHVLLKNGEEFHYALPAETPAKMGDLIEWYKNNTDDAVIVAADLHYRFVLIHPFDDGNGRIARLLMNYHLLKNNLPPVVIKSGDKKNYLRALQEADAGDIDSIRTYIAEKLVWSLELSIKAAKGENIDELGDWDKKLDLLKKGFKEQNKIVAKKSVETSKHTLEVVIVPFFNFLLNGIDKISELFIENSIDFKISVWDIKKLVSENNFFYYINAIVQREDLLPVENFNMIHNLIGYKHNGLNIFDLKSSFTFNLNEYSYSINLDSNPTFKIEKPYLQELSEQDFDLIANEITETLLKKVAETKINLTS